MFPVPKISKRSLQKNYTIFKKQLHHRKCVDFKFEKLDTIIKLYKTLMKRKNWRLFLDGKDD